MVFQCLYRYIQQTPPLVLYLHNSYGGVCVLKQEKICQEQLYKSTEKSVRVYPPNQTTKHKFILPIQRFHGSALC